MKDFSKRGFQISDSPTEAKLVYTGYLVFAFVGYLTIGLISFLRVGPGYESIVVHYSGSENEEMFPRAFGQMLEEAHFHAFIEGVTLLVLAHLFVATSVRRPIKVSIILLAFGSTLSDLASPWLIKYISGDFALLLMASWLGMGVSALALIGVPIHEMWLKKQRRRR